MRERARPRRDAGRHHQPGQRVDRDRRPAQARDELPGRLPVLARARQLAGAHALGRRAQPPAAGAAVRAAGQRAGARRADQRPRHRHAGAAGRAAAGLRRHGVPGQPRPALPRQRGDQHHRLGGRRAARLWREYEGGYEDWKLQRARAQLLRTGDRTSGRAAGPRPPRQRTRRRAGTHASSATRSSASSTRCPRASRRWRPSRERSRRAWPAATFTPRSRISSRRCKRATSRSRPS